MELNYYIVEEISLKDYLNRININHQLLKDIKLKGDILLNHQHVTVRSTLYPGDLLTLVLPAEENQLTDSLLPIHIVYEDDYLMIIDKSPDVPCIPVRSHLKDTVANRITHYYRENNIHAQVHLVNRLDKETRGLMMVAKSRYVHDLMSHQHTQRIYRAHAEGTVTQGTIDQPVLSIAHQKKRVIDEKGKRSITHYIQKGEYVYFKLETGRTHQIRVHMSSIGHPLVGDTLYGTGEGVFDLESIRLTFCHPITHQIISITKKGNHH